MSILMQRHVRVDGKVRTDATYPAGFMDVIDIPKTDEHFRLVYDTKGRFVAHRITKARRLRAARAARAAAPPPPPGSRGGGQGCQRSPSVSSGARGRRGGGATPRAACQRAGEARQLLSPSQLALDGRLLWIARLGYAACAQRRPSGPHCPAAAVTGAPRGAARAGGGRLQAAQGEAQPDGQEQGALHRHARRPHHPLPRPRHQGAPFAACADARRRARAARPAGMRAGCCGERARSNHAPHATRLGVGGCRPLAAGRTRPARRGACAPLRRCTQGGRGGKCQERTGGRARPGARRRPTRAAAARR